MTRHPSLFARRVRRLVVLAAVLALAFSSMAASQAVTVAALKAAFLYNFAKFTEWPADALAPAQRLSLCVVGDNLVADAVEQVIKGRVVDGHVLTVQILKPDGPLRSCHLLYIGGLDAKGARLLVGTLRDAPVLTVSDGERFAESGGVAQLILENDRMRFAINVAAAQRGRLQLSSKLLNLATIIKKENRDVQR
jgi:uncharacterized protein DUF4154